MATTKQKIAAQKTLENLRSDNPKTTGEILIESGYSETIATTPSQVTESKGFRQILDAYLPDDQLNRYLADDLEKKEGNRLGELKLAYELKGHIGRNADSGSNNVAVQVNVMNDKEKYG